MTKIINCAFLCLSILITGSYGYAQPGKYVGTWEGKIDVGVKLRFILNISDDGKGGLKTIAESPDQSTMKIPCESTVVSDTGITVNMVVGKVSYTARLINDTTLDGIFFQQKSFPLVLVRGSSTVAKLRPQTPKPPFPYESFDVEYDNADKTVHLSGTLTIPGQGTGIGNAQTAGYPVVIIISGSGGQDRDGSLFDHKLYYVLADYLSRQGIAVLRVDDPGIGKSTAKNLYNTTSADYADDVITSVEFLKTRKEINRKKIGLIGHSEGGMIAPMVAAKQKDIAFIVLWGAPVKGGRLTNIEQNELGLKRSGIDSLSVRAFSNLHSSVLPLLKTAKDTADLNAKLRPIWEHWKVNQQKNVLQSLGVNNDNIVNQNIYRLYGSLYQTPWMRFFLTYEPAIDLAKVRVPVLAINGSKDTQVDAQSNLKLISEILKKNKNPDFEVHELPLLNHMLQTANTGEADEYGTISETIAPSAMELMAVWIKKRSLKQN